MRCQVKGVSKHVLQMMQVYFGKWWTWSEMFIVSVQHDVCILASYHLLDLPCTWFNSDLAAQI